MKKRTKIFRLIFCLALFSLLSGCGLLKLKDRPSNIIIANDSGIASENFSEPISNEVIIRKVSQIDPDVLCELKKEMGYVDGSGNCIEPVGKIKKCFCDEDMEKWVLPVGFEIEKVKEAVRDETGAGLEQDTLVTRNRSLNLVPIDSIARGDTSKKNFPKDGIPQNSEIIKLSGSIINGIIEPAKIKKLNSNDVVVAIMDTGIDMRSFKNREAKFLDTSDFNLSCSTNGISGLTTGWNFVDNNQNIADNHGHGTLVTKNMLESLTTTKKNFVLLPLKIFDGNGKSSIWDVTCAFAYLNKLIEKKGYDIAIVNASFGAGISKEQFINHKKDFSMLKESIDKLQNKSIVVTSAGNTSKNNDSIYHFPSGYMSEQLFPTDWSTNVVSTAGLNTDAEISLFEKSNYGLTSVNTSALWEYNIVLTDRMELVANVLTSNDTGVNFAVLRGTSYSAAFLSSIILNTILENPSNLRGKELLDSVLRDQRTSEKIENKIKSGKYIK